MRSWSIKTKGIRNAAAVAGMRSYSIKTKGIRNSAAVAGVAGCPSRHGVSGYSAARRPEAAAENSGTDWGFAPRGSSPVMAGGRWVRVGQRRQPQQGTGCSWVRAQHALALGSPTAEKQGSKAGKPSSSAEGKETKRNKQNPQSYVTGQNAPLRKKRAAPRPTRNSRWKPQSGSRSSATLPESERLGGGGGERPPRTQDKTKQNQPNKKSYWIRKASQDSNFSGKLTIHSKCFFILISGKTPLLI